MDEFVNTLILAYLPETLIFGFLMIRLQFSPWMMALTLISVIVTTRFVIYDHTPDWDHHRRYITYLLTHRFIPPPPIYGRFNDPPLYYTLCALGFIIGDLFQHGWAGARAISHLMYVGYTLYALLLIRRFCFPLLAEITAVCIVLFWPCAPFRDYLNNDVGFYFFGATALYALQRWHEALKPHYFGAAFLLASLSLLCKTTGGITLTIVGIVAFYELVNQRITIRYFFTKSLAVYFVPTATCIGLYFGRLAYYRYGISTDSSWFTTWLTPFPNPAYLTWHKLSSFNIVEFIRSPYVNNTLSFWDIFFQSLICTTCASLYNRTPLHLLQGINFCWVILLGGSIWQMGKCIRWKQTFHCYAVPLISIGTLIGMVILQRSVVPFVLLGYGRYVYPITTLFGIMLAGLLSDLHKSGEKRLYLGFFTVTMAFAAMSFAHGLYDNIQQ